MAKVPFTEALWSGLVPIRANVVRFIPPIRSAQSAHSAAAQVLV